MNGKKCKALRRAAREEMAGRPLWEWVTASSTNQTTAINAPDTQRAMYLKLKKRDNLVSRTKVRVDASGF